MFTWAGTVRAVQPRRRHLHAWNPSIRLLTVVGNSSATRMFLSSYWQREW